MSQGHVPTQHKEEALNPSSQGNSMLKEDGGVANPYIERQPEPKPKQSFRALDDIDTADKYLIRHKCKFFRNSSMQVGENVRDCEDIDDTNLPDYVKK